ncbi:MAG: hypothetical protein ACKVP7_19330 [Hyphomicrobiaceae bacterium]
MLQRLSLSMGSIAISMVLGHIALAYVGIFYPERLEGMIEVAGMVKKWIVGAGIPSKYNVWIRLLLEEKSLLFMFFSLMARVVILMLTGSIAWAWNRIRA